jgi:hypothetical protein
MGKWLVGQFADVTWRPLTKAPYKIISLNTFKRLV